MSSHAAGPPAGLASSNSGWTLRPADFRPAGADHQLVLGADLLVPGRLEPVDLPVPRATDTTTDGYPVTLHGTPDAYLHGAAGVARTAAFTVEVRGG